MTKHTHTSGPWIVQTWNYQDRHRRNIPVIVTKSDAICELYNLLDWENDREPERLANARLIAAAPDLLQIAKDYVSLCQWHDIKGAALDLALASIAKAEGRAEP